jgi:hypothetical protein
MHVQRTWEWQQAERLDDEGRLASEIHTALDRVLALLDEPPLASEAGSGDRGAAVEQQPVDAVVAS